MGRWGRTTACERAGQWISLELDDELGEFERAALARHLNRCDRCFDSWVEIAAFTRVIRDEPLVPPPAPVSALPVRRGRSRRARRGAAVCALAAVLASATAAYLLPQGSPVSSSITLASATQAQRLRFASAEHARIEPQAPDSAPARPWLISTRI